MSRNDYLEIRSAYLAHTGVKGMKWRFHKYTNKILSGGRNLYQYAQRKATYYGGQARRELNKAKRVVRKGINNIGSSLQKAGRVAYHNINAKYNPSALMRRYNRAKSINALNKATKAHSNAGGVNKFGSKMYTVNYDVKNGKLVETGRTLVNRTNRFGTSDDDARRRGVGNQIKSAASRIPKKKKSRW